MYPAISCSGYNGFFGGNNHYGDFAKEIYVGGIAGYCVRMYDVHNYGDLNITDCRFDMAEIGRIAYSFYEIMYCSNHGNINVNAELVGSEYVGKMEADNVEINVSDYDFGIYFINIITEKGSIAKRFVKN